MITINLTLRFSSGFCYGPEVLLAYCRFAEKWNIYLVSDEIYALGFVPISFLTSIMPSVPSTLTPLSVYAVLTLTSSSNSVFHAPDLPSPVSFTSILSLDVEKDAGCNPARVVQLYGMSKDFGANGVRAGCLVAQNNPLLLRSLMGNAMVMRMGSPSVRSAFSPRSHPHPLLAIPLR